MNTFLEAQEGLKAGEAFHYEGKDYIMVQYFNTLAPERVLKVGPHVGTPQITPIHLNGRWEPQYTWVPEIPDPPRGYIFVRDGWVYAQTQSHAIGMRRGVVHTYRYTGTHWVYTGCSEG